MALLPKHGGLTRCMREHLSAKKRSLGGEINEGRKEQTSSASAFAELMILSAIDPKRRVDAQIEEYVELHYSKRDPLYFLVKAWLGKAQEVVEGNPLEEVPCWLLLTYLNEFQSAIPTQIQ